MLNKCIRRNFFPLVPKKQRSKKKKLRLISGKFRRSNLTLVSNVCEATPISLFWAPKDDKLPERMHFDVPFNLIGKSTMAF